MNYGISVSACFAKAKEFMIEKDMHKVYLSLLDYFTAFASENNFKTIEIASFPPFDADVLLPIQEDIKKRIAKFETIYHLPSWEINICAVNPHVRKASIDETKRLIDLARGLGIRKVSMHPGCYAAMPDLYALLGHQVKNIAHNSVFEVFDYCKYNDIDMCIENLPCNEPFFQNRKNLSRSWIRESACWWIRPMQ